MNTALFIPSSILHILDQDFWQNVLQLYKIIIQHLQGLKNCFIDQNLKASQGYRYFPLSMA
ncbi:hypothetical protein D7221_00440 [Legionella pneumophila]|uniref:Uncharacterized protein n=1 Tax=Legionella pneumophila (strain Lens) TaxID=297245 RepID=Q5WVK2_LEGPL|nr:hypothetical protein BE841_03790 [Legionella pneumophila subsp. pneumophila]RYW86118.1 hypothetical protein D7216_00445 [Legionella pneumophila]CAH16052.1 hypothetical protein lpl1813 [Legionella pneumophila str. Lens]AOW54776.1 hypothetical protein BE842_04965 [Legionella pneumophila subsp. pneumophila]AOW56923.1 hypothetical protein BE843_01000 [Legionella pneumophila subsp. pneumophila]